MCAAIEVVRCACDIEIRPERVHHLLTLCPAGRAAKQECEQPAGPGRPPFRSGDTTPLLTDASLDFKAPECEDAHLLRFVWEWIACRLSFRREFFPTEERLVCPCSSVL